MSPFDFSAFFGGSNTRTIEFLGLTQEQTAQILEDQHGLSQALMNAYPDVCKQGYGPNSITKTLIVFESYGRDTTYNALADALDVKADTAYQLMCKVRKQVKAAFGLNIEHSGERCYLVTNQTLAEKAERLDGHIKKASRAIEALQADVNSIRRSGQTPVLPGTAGALLAGYEQAMQLQGATDN